MKRIQPLIRQIVAIEIGARRAAQRRARVIARMYSQIDKIRPKGSDLLVTSLPIRGYMWKAGWKAGRIFSVTPENAVRLILNGTHGLSTLSEAKAWKLNQEKAMVFFEARRRKLEQATERQLARVSKGARA